MSEFEDNNKTQIGKAGTLGSKKPDDISVASGNDSVLSEITPEGITAEGNDDKTRLAPNPQQKSKQRKAQELKVQRLKAQLRKAQILKAQQEKNRQLKGQILQQQGIGSEEEKTQIKAAMIPQPLSDDLTQIAPSDRTRIAPNRNAPPALSPIDHSPLEQDFSDKTQFAKPKRSTSLSPVLDSQELPQDTGEFSNRAGNELLKNRFILEEVLGAGGMGVVYKAKDRLKVEANDRDPYLAIKVLSEDFRSHPEAFIALQRESRKTQRIAHPNIVNVHDFDRDGETVFMTMEYLEGKPLDKLISQYKATGLPEDDAWKILEGICAALVHAHAENIIHSDFKPGNIYVTNRGSAKVFDFGIARAVASAENLEESVDDRTVFDAGNLGALTPAYASLEMLEGETPDVRDDIYALGCIACELFSGMHPYDRVHANEVSRGKLKPKRVHAFSKRQWKVIEKAIALKREDRIASVDEFWKQLTQAKSSPLKLVLPAVLILSLTAFAGYQSVFNEGGTQISEDEVRSEIEMQLRLEQHQNNFQALLESVLFTNVWESTIWKETQELRRLLGQNSDWLSPKEVILYQAYLEKIAKAIGAEELELARRIIENAPRYTTDTSELTALQKRLSDVMSLVEQREREKVEAQRLAAQQKKTQQAEAKDVIEKRNVFNQAMTNVDEQLACRSGLNMRDLDIAIKKLRSVNMAEYKKREGGIVLALSKCISKIGRSFPERAMESKKFALRIFPENASVATIKIVPKDPCDTALAGLGASGKRAICRDRLGTQGKGPAMVVIPGFGSMKEFAIGKYEVSVAEINVYCKESGKCEEISGVSKSFPVTNIPNSLVKDYLRWLGDKAKRKYRLPTKAEWVYAARAQSGKLDSNRNCRLNSRGIQKGDALIKASVGRQNKWGVVNHVGNAQEWVIDTGGRIAAVGGSYKTAMESCTLKSVEKHSGSADEITGFRVLREIVER